MLLVFNLIHRFLNRGKTYMLRPEFQASRVMITASHIKLMADNEPDAMDELTGCDMSEELITALLAYMEGARTSKSIGMEALKVINENKVDQISLQMLWDFAIHVLPVDIFETGV